MEKVVSLYILDYPERLQKKINYKHATNSSTHAWRDVAWLLIYYPVYTF